jgi:rhodanese-related sulfurtransferase
MASALEVSREQLCETLDCAGDMVLVDARSPISYVAARLPGAINIPTGTVDERAPRRIPDRDTEVVVYCQGGSCDASVAVAGRLIELGYQKVRQYVGGKQDWEEAGLPLEGGRT